MAFRWQLAEFESPNLHMLSSFFCSFSWVRAPPKEMKSDIKWAFFTYSNTLEIHVKLIGVQSNHGVEYFGGPALPTLRFLHNQWFPHNQHNILMAATCLGRCCHQQEKWACSQHIVITRFASQEVSYGACRQRLLEKWAFYDLDFMVYLKIYHSPCLFKKSLCQKFGKDGFIIENSEAHGSTGKHL